MNKNKIHVTLISNGTKDEYTILGNFYKEDNIITYKESKELISNLTLDLNKKILIKDNIDYIITLNFKENEITSNEILLKKENKILKLELETIKLDIKEKEVYIKYKIIDSNEIIEYNVLIGE